MTRRNFDPLTYLVYRWSGYTMAVGIIVIIGLFV